MSKKGEYSAKEYSTHNGSDVVNVSEELREGHGDKGFYSHCDVSLTKKKAIKSKHQKSY